MELERIQYKTSDESVFSHQYNLKVKSLESEKFEFDEDDKPIKWTNILFVPFQFWWQTIVLYLVCVKCFFGPMKAVLPFLTCSPDVDKSIFLKTLKISYVYVCDVVYMLDTFLHILHRQVAEEAMKHDFLPKSAFLILIDVLSLIPFYGMFVTFECKVKGLWPNILTFSELLTIYRVGKYFSLYINHNYLQLLLGYTIMFVLVLNATTCFMLLVTIHGMCAKCVDSVKWHYDWRANTLMLQEKNYNLLFYIQACEYVFSLLVNHSVDDTRVRTYTGYILSIFVMFFGYFVVIFVIMPKLFAENILRLRPIYSFYPRAKRILEETKRRNGLAAAYRSLEKFYCVIWKKRDGITATPKAIDTLPWCIRVEIIHDMIWPVFHHSPTLRNTSWPFKRWISSFIKIKYRLPGERFFAGLHCYTDLYYVKTGIVQFISSDDSTAPMLSVDGGSIFGDISFFVPPMKRKVIVRCLTYCQVFTISRAVMLRALHLFPEDRRNIMKQVRKRLAHARSLYKCKEQEIGMDRVHKEGIKWIKLRWWEINKHVNIQEKRGRASRKNEFHIPPDNEVCHCAKYIGQLVLCDEQKLQKKPIFVKVKFPFILTPLSAFAFAWHRIVITTIYFVLFVYPPNLMRQSFKELVFFTFVSGVVDIIYTMDVVISLVTAEDVEEKLESNLGIVMYERIKKKVFILDVLSTVLFEKSVVLLFGSMYSGLAPFNRLIKTYLLFFNRHKKTWHKNQDPLRHVLVTLLLSTFCYFHIFPNILFVSLITTHLKKVFSIHNHFGYLCSKIFRIANLTATTNKCTIGTMKYGILEVVIAWTIKHIIPSHHTKDQTIYDDIFKNWIALFTIGFFLYHKMKIISTLYLKHVERINYQCFVSNLKRHYMMLKIHPTLLKRLNNYLNCHWKYYHGSDIIHPNLLKDEPYDVYWKLHGEIAESIIAQSRAFKGADPELIRELAHRSKFLIIPRNSTLAVFGSQTDKVSWVFRGYLRSVYNNEKGEILKVFAPRGSVLCMAGVFLGRISLRTYIAESDVEILYINQEEFNRIIKRFPDELSFFVRCKEEYKPIFDEMFVAYLKNQRNYQKKLQDDNLYDKQQISDEETILSFKERIYEFFIEFRRNPESKLIRCWMTFRVFILFLTLTLRPSFFMSETIGRQILDDINYSSDAIAVVDIIIKMFLPYYDERGLIIHSIRKCAFHYVTRCFVADVIGCLFGFIETINLLITNQSAFKRVLENAFPYCHLYILTGYFNYYADEPSANTSILMVLKWFLIIIPISTSAIRILFWLCIEEVPDDFANIVIDEKCWIPAHFTIWERKPSYETVHIIIANAANTVLSFLLNHSIVESRLFHFDNIVYAMAFRVFLIVIFWFITCYYLMLFILKYRGDSMFEHGVGQLKSFLKEERINDKLIDRSMDYFSYWWTRTSGVNMKILLNERVGAIFRQDLNYYFFKKTLQATGNLLYGGDILKKLAYYASVLYFLPGEDIIREMDLCPHLFIVHRGQVELTKEGKRLAVLTKGSIFGQLSAVKLRPIYVTAKAVHKADVLMISVKDFHEIISDNVRKAISNHPNLKKDYINVKKPVEESPYNTIEYILRGNKAIRFPYMKKVVRAEKSVWYARWLLCALLVNPILCTALTLLRASLPQKSIRTDYFIYCWLLVTDVIHIIHLVTEFFTMKLAVVEIYNIPTCVYKYNTLKKFKDWRFYADVISLLLPYMYFISGRKTYHWLLRKARLLRIHAVVIYYRLFCGSFKARRRANVIKITMFMLLIHALVCFHILVGCRTHTGKNFPVRLFPIPETIKLTIDNTSWRDMRTVRDPDSSILVNGFLAPSSWQADYIIALTFVMIIFTSTNNYYMLVPVTIVEIYYTMFIMLLVYFVKLWITSFVISSVYTSYSEMYNFDFQVITLLKYLKRNGVSDFLRTSCLRYTKLLWLRTRGNWLPKITHDAPQCLREDILSALYMHHLLAPALFHNLPEYFLRQLAVRLTRIVIFPGKRVVEAGDIEPTIYFIHEGEVEKWYTDKNGDQKLASVLTTNGYFGLIPGLFPNTPYAFSYTTRTVVDFVYLENKAWQDLLEGYPEVKTEIYSGAAKRMYNREGAMASRR